MTRPGLRWCLGYSALLAVLTSLPYLVAMAQPDEGWVFTGSLIAVEDGNSYVAKMRLGAEGDWLFRTPYSTLPQRGVLAFLPYLMMGKLAGAQPTHATLVLLYHGLRVAAIPLAVAATYRFLAMWIVSETWRRWGTALSTLGGGLGWLLLLLPGDNAVVPLELYSPEAFGFLASFAFPHLILARAALLFGLSWYLAAARQANWGWKAGVIWLALGLLQPLALVSAAAAVTAHGLSLVLRSAPGNPHPGWRRWLKAAAPALLIPAPVLLYLAASYLGDPTVQAWARQNLLPSPPLSHYLIGYLLLLPLAASGARGLLQQPDGRMLVLWPVLVLALAYAPVGVQRRLVEGAWVALAVLAGAGIEQIPEQRRWRRQLGIAVLALSLPSSILIVALGLRIASRPAEPAFRPVAEVGAYDWLAAHAPRGSVVLSSFPTGNALPAWAPVHVVIGHGPETAGLDRLRPEVEAFFDPASPDTARRALIESQGVAYLMRGPHERSLGAWDPARADFLEPVYEESGYAIYATR